MQRQSRLVLATLLTVLAPCAAAAQMAVETDALEASLRAAETAFAKTMADRDLEAFAAFLDEQAVFSGPGGVLRGPQQVVAGWSRYFEGEEAPFSWRPERVHVVADGSLGGTTGPVLDSDGRIVGQFVSTWRRDAAGGWKVVLDMAPDCSAIGTTVPDPD